MRSLSSSHIKKWLHTGPSLVSQIQETCHLILTDERFTSDPPRYLRLRGRSHPLWHTSIGKPPPLLSLQNPGICCSVTRAITTFFITTCKFNEKQKLVLELWWSAIPESGRPWNMPWRIDGKRLEGVRKGTDAERMAWWEEWMIIDDLRQSSASLLMKT